MGPLLVRSRKDWDNCNFLKCRPTGGWDFMRLLAVEPKVLLNKAPPDRNVPSLLRFAFDDARYFFLVDFFDDLRTGSLE